MLTAHWCMQGHLEEVDAVATRVDVAARQLDSLRQTSVLEDCFHIWCAAYLQPVVCASKLSTLLVYFASETWGASSHSLRVSCMDVQSRLMVGADTLKVDRTMCSVLYMIVLWGFPVTSYSGVERYRTI